MTQVICIIIGLLAGLMTGFALWKLEEPRF